MQDQSNTQGQTTGLPAATPREYANQKIAELRQILGLPDNESLSVAVSQLISVASGQQVVSLSGLVLVPKRMTRAMREVCEQEGWQWGDVLAAAHAVSEVEYIDAEKSEDEAIDAVVACLGDDAARLREVEPEVAKNMGEAAELLEKLRRDLSPEGIAPYLHVRLHPLNGQLNDYYRIYFEDWVEREVGPDCLARWPGVDSPGYKDTRVQDYRTGWLECVKILAEEGIIPRGLSGDGFTGGTLIGWARPEHVDYLGALPNWRTRSLPIEQVSNAHCSVPLYAPRKEPGQLRSHAGEMTEPPVQEKKA